MPWETQDEPTFWLVTSVQWPSDGISHLKWQPQCILYKLLPLYQIQPPPWPHHFVIPVAHLDLLIQIVRSVKSRQWACEWVTDIAGWFLALFSYWHCDYAAAQFLPCPFIFCRKKVRQNTKQNDMWIFQYFISNGKCQLLILHLTLHVLFIFSSSAVLLNVEITNISKLITLRKSCSPGTLRMSGERGLAGGCVYSITAWSGLVLCSAESSPPPPVISHIIF